MKNDERHARKQVLLTRIAFERDELRREWAHVHRAVEPRQVLRALIGDSLGSSVSRVLFGNGRARPDDLIGQALTWLRRYRVAATLVGGALPLLRGGAAGTGRWRRLLRIGVLVGAGWLGWRVARGGPPTE